MAKDNATNKIIQISIAALFVAILAWTAMGLLFSATNYTSTTEDFTGVNLTYVDLGNTQPLITSGESIYNATSGVILPDSGTNYTMNNTDGSIQINTTSGYMVAGVYTINYHQGAVDSTVVTIGKLLIGLVFFIVIIIILLKHAGIDVK